MSVYDTHSAGALNSPRRASELVGVVLGAGVHLLTQELGVNVPALEECYVLWEIWHTAR